MDKENRAEAQKETKQEQKHNADQSQEHDNNNKEVNSVWPQHQQGPGPGQDEAQLEDETSRESIEHEDTEQVETFFSTMSHRYENATVEGHIL